MNTLFTREEFPYSILNDFGLTNEMIEDLPESVMEVILQGGYSPLLPICHSEDNIKFFHCRAKFKLVRMNDDELDVMFLIQRTTGKSPDLDDYTNDEEIKKILDGGSAVMLQTVNDIQLDGGEILPKGSYVFAQVDVDTNQVLVAPSPTIGKNLMTVQQQLNLTGEDIKRIQNGDVVTVKHPETLEKISVGVNLFDVNGVQVVKGESYFWKQYAYQTMDEYSFGNDGVWINRKGVLDYVKNEAFTEEILAAEQHIRDKNLHRENHAFNTAMEEENSDKKLAGIHRH